MSRRQQLLIDTHATRQQASDLLKNLEDSRRALEAQLAGEKREDVVKLVTGRSALEAAIANTRRMIDALDRALEEARNGHADVDVAEALTLPEEEEAVEIAGRIGVTQFNRMPATAGANGGRWAVR